MNSTSGRQRNYALAMGIVSDANSDGEWLSQTMDQVKAELSGPPNQSQVLLARQWDVEVRAGATGWDVLDKLYQMIQTRAFVYSVMRRLTGERWQYYTDSGLNTKWIDEVARRLIANPEHSQQVADLENSSSGKKTDAWCRFGKRQWELAAVQEVLHAAHGSPASASMADQIPPPVPPAAPPVAVPTTDHFIVSPIGPQQSTARRLKPRTVRQRELRRESWLLPICLMIFIGVLLFAIVLAVGNAN